MQYAICGMVLTSPHELHEMVRRNTETACSTKQSMQNETDQYVPEDGYFLTKRPHMRLIWGSFHKAILATIDLSYLRLIFNIYKRSTKQL